MTIRLTSIFRVTDVGFEVVEGGGLQWEVITSSVTATEGSGYLCDTSSSLITLTLPSGPSIGDQIGIKDYARTFQNNNLTINPNGKKLDGSTNNISINQERFYTILVYSGTDRGWLFTDQRTNHGTGVFAGSGGETTIAHGFAVTPVHVNVTPTSDPSGYLGEMWVRKDSTNIYVGNSGSHTGNFDWSATI